MRIAAATLIGAFGLAAVAASADAAPLVPRSPAQQESNIVQIAGGCGWGYHPNRWGRCIRDRHGYARPRPYRYGYYPQWHTPSDFVANQLNRQELGRLYSGGGVYYGRPGWGY